MRRWSRPFWLLLGALFLFEAWVWDACIRLCRAILACLPWADPRTAIAGAIGRLPPYGALALFLIPLAVIEPFKIVSLWLIARDHWILGVAGFVAAKFVGFELIAFLFDCAREKLLSIPWMAVLYRLVLRWRDWAHALMAPYKARVGATIAAARAMLALHLRTGGDFGRKLRRLRRRGRTAPRL